MNNLILEKGQQGKQQTIGDISENAAGKYLMQRHGLGETQPEALKKFSDKLESSKVAHDDPEDSALREHHGQKMGEAISEHIKNSFPGYNVTGVHNSNKGNFSEITGGVHKDTAHTNPSDLVVELHHPKTGEKKFFGASLKSTKTSGDIGFKNPTPKTLDNHLAKSGYPGLDRNSMHKSALEKLLSLHPKLRNLPNKAPKSNPDKPNRKETIASDSDVQRDAKQIADENHKNVAKTTADFLTNNVLSKDGNHNQHGHDVLKKHFINNVLNTKSSMPYAKFTAMGNMKSGSVKSEDVADSHVVGLLHHPKSKMRVRHSGGHNVHYDVQDPDTGKWHGVASEQVKHSSAFGYSSPRHNIHPPQSNIPQD